MRGFSKLKKLIDKYDAQISKAMFPEHEKSRKYDKLRNDILELLKNDKIHEEEDWLDPIVL